MEKLRSINKKNVDILIKSRGSWSADNETSPAWGNNGALLENEVFQIARA